MSEEVGRDEKLVEREPSNRDLAAIDKLVFEPRRFAMLNVLSGGGKADYPFLQRMTGLSMGALATHLGRMEEAGLIEVRKEFVFRKPKTFVLITPEGERRLEDSWKRMERARPREADTQASLFDEPE